MDEGIVECLQKRIQSREAIGIEIVIAEKQRMLKKPKKKLIVES